MSPRVPEAAPALLDELFERARRGDERSIARLLSAVEEGGGRARRVGELAASAVYPAGASTGHLVGVTGAPGAGKSTLVAALVDVCRARSEKVAVLAVDPSSPVSGGALLGDRIRMQRHALDRGVFIRSLSSRGILGGLSPAVPGSVELLRACCFEVVVVETVGIGQSEVEIARTADSVVLVVAPGSGDSVQAAKAGVLEVADLVVVSKSDLDGATALAEELRRALGLAPPARGGEPPPVLSVAASAGRGVGDVVAALDARLREASASGELAERRRAAAAARIEALAAEIVVRRGRSDSRALLAELADALLTGALDAWSAADALVTGG